MRGYGKILDIHQGNYTNYDVTEISCLPVRKGTVKDLREIFDRIVIHDTGQLSPEKPEDRFFKSLEKLRSIIKKDFLVVDSHMGANGFIVWGKIKPNIGYLNIFVMGDYAGLGASRTESEAVLKTTLDQIMEYFRSVEAVVVDVRFNTGGHDRVSMMIANRFADRKRLAFTTKAVYGKGFTEEQEFSIRPEGNFQFTGPTFLLTSERTVSAGESFALYMMACPHVTRIGGTTAGAFSNALTMHLPNGWRLEMSNEVVVAADGHVYEGIGIPPQVEVPVFIPGNIYPGLKQAVDKAVFLAEKAIAKETIEH